MRISLLFLLACMSISPARAQRAEVYHPQIPVLTDGEYNIAVEIVIESGQPFVLNSVGLRIEPSLPLKWIGSVGLIYTGGASSLHSRTESWTLREQVKYLGGSQKLFRHPAYGIGIGAVEKPKTGTILFTPQYRMPAGKNYMVVCLAIDPKRADDLTRTFEIAVDGIRIDGENAALSGNQQVEHRLGVALRQAGDFGVDTYRIPGFVAAADGTLVAVFDVRHTSRLDVQDNIDIGVSRSSDGGRTWGRNQTIIDMGTYGNLPQSQNGMCDAAILRDDVTGDLLVVASWSHGFANNKVFGNKAIQPGLDPVQTPQILLVRSRDHGKTWSEPVNITSQVKDPSWNFTFEGPGSGICMRDGTLVFPMQYIHPDGQPSSAVMYSRDRGHTWKTHNHALKGTTEAQVVELGDGSLMLNMRNNRRTGRVVYTTSDLGRTWKEHPTSEKELIEPVCNASLIRVRAEDNVTGRDILFFLNPNSTEGRKSMTVKASLDEGNTWLPEHQLLIDEESGWGYPSMAMIDRRTLGVVYEGSVAQLVYQAIRIVDVVGDLSSAPLGTGEWIRERSPGGECEGFREGVSGQSAGLADGKPVVAGGCNFPGYPSRQNAVKTFYDKVFTLDGDDWKELPSLPYNVAYAAAATTPRGLVVAGGSNETGLLDKALLVDGADVKRLPELPLALDQAAGACIGAKVYVAGGNTAEGVSSALLMLDMDDPGAGWSLRRPMPQGLIQPVAGACGGKLYVFGGYGRSDGKSVVDCAGYRYDPATDAWSDIPRFSQNYTFTGSSSAVVDDRYILFTGGVNRDLFETALDLPPEGYLEHDPAWYRFSRLIVAYDTRFGEWSVAGASRHTARAGASAVVADGKLHLTGGELKPRLRTPQTWSAKIIQSRQ